MLTQLLWDVILQVSGHEQLEALIINGLHEEGKSTQVNRRRDAQERRLHRPRMENYERDVMEFD